MEKQSRRQKLLTGMVVSDKMDKTAVVAVERRFKHPLYKKMLKKVKKFKAHDEQNICRVGDRIQIIESRPISKTKRWRFVRTIKKAE